MASVKHIIDIDDITDLTVPLILSRLYKFMSSFLTFFGMLILSRIENKKQICDDGIPRIVTV